MKPNQPAGDAPLFRYFSPVNTDFEPYYLVPTQIVSEPAQRNLRGLTPEQAAPWLQRYPVLRYIAVTEGFRHDWAGWITPKASGMTFQHPIPEWVAEVWADRAVDFDKRLNAVRMGLGGYPLSSEEFLDGFAAVFADETGLIATNDWGDTYVFFPAHPDELALDRAFVTALKHLPETRRKAFVDAHLNAYPDPRAFVAHVAKNVGTEALFMGEGLHPVRVHLLNWLREQQAYFYEIDSLKNPQALTENKAPGTAAKPEVFKLNYGPKNAEVVRLLYDELNGKLFDCDFKQWERLFTDNGQPLQPIAWQGREVQLTTLFQRVNLDSSRIYRQLVTHFRKKDGQEYNSAQMPVSFSKAKENQPIVSGLIEKVNRLVKT